jgi:hypothetical protein
VWCMPHHFFDDVYNIRMSGQICYNGDIRYKAAQAVV